MGPDLKESPRKSANFFSRLFFWWVTPLFRNGNDHTLKAEDLYRVLQDDMSGPLGDRLEMTWDQEVRNCHPTTLTGKRPSLFKVLWKLFGPRYLLLGGLVGFGELVVQIAQPICLGLLIRCVDEGQGVQNSLALTLIGGLILTSILYPLTNHTYFFQTQRQGMQIRIACSSLIYRKSLKMSIESLRRGTAGQILNLLSNDVNRFDQFLTYLHFIWVAPIQVGIVVCILWTYFGVYCLTGISVLVLFAPLQGVMGKCFGKLRSKTATMTDNRLRILTEVISAIHMIKIQAWEALFSAKLIDARRDEICRIRKTAMLRAINLTLHNISSKLIVFITLLVYVLNGHSLSAEKVFVTIAFYNSVRRVFTYCVPLGVSNWAEVKISIKRIQEFLIDSETNCSATSTKSKASDYKRKVQFDTVNEETAIKLVDFSAKWDSKVLSMTLDHNHMTLDHLTLEIPKQSLVAVVGKTGSGKSSFLQAILQELTPSTGRISIYGKISYAPQEPWIFEGTIRDNIIFCQLFDPHWYNQVIHACALKKDLTLLPDGDQTFVGDKGTCLSGGQRARINLARAVYTKSDIILLDDPWSSLDVKVANHIFNECILKVLKGRTCILVTHQVQFLPNCDNIIILENGSVRSYGYYWDLIVNESMSFSKKADNTDESDDTKDQSRLVLIPKPRKTRLMSTTSEVNIEEWNVVLDDDDVDIDNFNQPEKYPGGIPDPISVSSGRSRDLYLKYIWAGTGSLGMIVFGVLTVFAQMLYTGSDYWLQIWVKTETRSKDLTIVSNYSRSSTDFFQRIYNDRNLEILIYVVVFASLVIVSLLRTLYYFRICMKSSINLHNKVFDSILKAPMQFFKHNQPGKILNVFSKDVGIVDELLPATLFEALEAGFNVIGVLVVVSLINPILLGPSVVLVSLFLYLRKLYIGTARNIKRLEGSTKSPVFSHMSSTLNGLVIIRAFNAQSDLRSQFDKHQDLHTSAWFLTLSTTRWLAFVVESISVMFISCVALSFVFYGLDGPSMGLAISSAMTLSAMFQWGVRQSAEAESQLISVERVSQYSKVKSEPIMKSNGETQIPEPSWPSKGAITFKNVTVTFDDGTHEKKPVLHNLSFKISAGEKLGVVGRTGAGKSTLVSCLFRLVDPIQGKIVIDGKSIEDLRLMDLRPRISIIPQEPMLFTGSLRQNLDPWGHHMDDEIWVAIKAANLNTIVKDIPAGLDALVGDKGISFSVGEKQLLCLARALLERNKILVLDEATAFLDKATDDMIQETIRENFSDCTTISIAHRLETIIDCDRVLVLNAGKVMEFDAPFELVRNNLSHFYQMVQELGEPCAKLLFLRAQEAHLLRTEVATEEKP